MYIMDNRYRYIIVFRQTPIQVEYACWDPFDAYRVYNGATAIYDCTLYSTLYIHFRFTLFFVVESIENHYRYIIIIMGIGICVVEKTTTGGQTSRPQPYRSDRHESVKRMTTQSRDVVYSIHCTRR